MSTFTHGMTHTPTYKSWLKMKERCFDKNNNRFAMYGKQGITVCDKWLKFEGFFEDMGIRQEGMTIDRIDNEKGYSKENCKWSTAKEQANNRKSNNKITFNGETHGLKEWAELLGINPRTLTSRITLYKWSIERALTGNLYKTNGQIS